MTNERLPIVERLRSWMFDQSGELGATAHEAADTIERLVAALECVEAEIALDGQLQEIVSDALAGVRA